MATQFLDKAGATFLIGKVKTLFNGLKTKLDTIDEGAQVNSIEGATYIDYDKNTEKTVTIKDKKLEFGKLFITENRVESVAASQAKSYLDQTLPTQLRPLTSRVSAVESGLTDAEANINGLWSSVSKKQDEVTFNSAYNATTNKAATMLDISNAVSDITGFDFVIVETLPETGDKGKIYLVEHSHGTSDLYDEYIYVTDKWEKIGTTDIDLSNCVKYTDVITDTEIEAMFS